VYRNGEIDRYADINHSKFLLFAGDLKTRRIVKSVEDFKAVRVDTDFAQKRRVENCVQITV
jgi:hypothetical protein